MAGSTMTATAMKPEVAFGLDAIAAPGLTFEDLLSRYQAELYRYAFHLTRNRADADDLSQETLIKAYRAFDRLDRTANRRAWLYRIATNTFLSNRRRAGRDGSLDAACELAAAG